MVPALVIYIGLMMQIADFVTDIHIILDFLFYAVAGLAWIPLAGKVVGWLACIFHRDSRKWFISCAR